MANWSQPLFVTFSPANAVKEFQKMSHSSDESGTAPTTRFARRICKLVRLIPSLLLAAGIAGCADTVAPTSAGDYLGGFTVPDYNAWTGDTVYVAAQAVTTANGLLIFLGEDLHVKWTSSNPAVFTIMQDGKETTQFPTLKMIGPGQATLAGTVDDSRINPKSLVTGGQATVTVTPRGKMQATPHAVTIPIGETRTFSIGFVTQTGATAVNPKYIFDFLISNGNFATVSSTPPVNPADPTIATIKAISAGSFRIFVRAFNKSDKNMLGQTYFEDTVVVTIPAPAVPTKVTVNPTQATLFVGGTKQVSAQVFDQSNNVMNAGITWISSDTTLAKVSSSGLVSAVGTGNSTFASAQITARAAAGVEAVTSLIIYKPIASVLVDPNPKSLQIGASHVFTATLKDNTGATIPAAATAITWSVVDPSIASVDQNGKATGLVVGATKLKVTTTEGISGTSDVTVEAVPLATVVRVVVTPASITLNLSDTQCQFTAKAFDANGNEVQVAGFRWIIDDSSIATLDGTGLAKFKRAGTTTIRAFYGDAANAPGGSASLTVR
jgi:hypothetical protein